MRKITNYEVDGLKSITNTLPESRRSEFLRHYMNSYFMTSYFVEVFKDVIDKEMFSTSTGLTIALADLYVSLFDPNAYIKNPGNISILLNDHMWEKYNFDIAPFLENRTQFKSDVSEFLLKKNTAYATKILDLSTVTFLAKNETIEKYHEYYSEKAIERIGMMGYATAKLLCSGKTFRVDRFLTILLKNTITIPSKKEDYSEFISSVGFSTEGMSNDEVANTAFLIVDLIKENDYDRGFSETMIKHLTKTLSFGFKEMIMAILEKENILDDAAVAGALRSFTDAGVPVYAKITVAASDDLNMEEYLW